MLRSVILVRSIRVPRCTPFCCLLIVSAASLLTGCGGWRSGHRMVSAGTESLPALAIRTIRDSSNVPVRVDPSRLPPELDEKTAIPTAAHIREDLAFSAISDLGRVGKRIGGAAAQDSCGGVLMPAHGGSHAGCPNSQETWVVIGAPRQGGALRISDSDSARRIEASESAPEFWTIRILETSIGPRGFATAPTDYVFRRSDHEWLLVRRVRLFYIE